MRPLFISLSLSLQQSSSSSSTAKSDSDPLPLLTLHFVKPVMPFSEDGPSEWAVKSVAAEADRSLKHPNSRAQGQFVLVLAGTRSHEATRKFAHLLG